MSGIDYSKWDQLCDSDDSADSGGPGPRGPRVTRLEYPSRVVVGPSGVHMATPPPVAAQSPFSPPPPPPGPGPLPAPPLPAPPREDDQAEEDDMMYANLTRNGGREGDSHLWAQTRDTASVSFIMPSMHTRSKDVSGFRLVAEEQTDHTSRGVISFCLSGAERATFVLRYPVKINEDLVMGCWQMHSLPTRSLRLMTVQLVKETIALGAVLWWDRCFVSDATIIDTKTIAGRSDAAATRAEEFHRAWTQAHEDFKQQVKERRAPHTL